MPSRTVLSRLKFTATQKICLGFLDWSGKVYVNSYPFSTLWAQPSSASRSQYLTGAQQLKPYAMERVQSTRKTQKHSFILLHVLQN